MDLAVVAQLTHDASHPRNGHGILQNIKWSRGGACDGVRKHISITKEVQHPKARLPVVDAARLKYGAKL